MTETPDFFDGFFKKLQRRRIRKVLWAWLKWTFLFLILLVIFLWFVLQTERFQNWALNKVTTYLSEELDTRVEAERIDFDFFNKLVLEGFYLEDRAQDTLLYTKRLKASMSADLISLLNKEFDIDDIYLEDAQINIVRDTGQYDNNLQFILDKLSKGPKEENDTLEKVKTPFFLDVDRLFLDRIRFVKDDRVSGQLIKVDLDHGEIIVEELNIPDKIIAIKEGSIQNPQVELIEREENPLPPREEEEEENNEENKQFVLTVGHFELDDGAFSLDNYRKAPVKTSPDDEVDFKHLTVQNIKIDLDDYQMLGGKHTFKINGISADEKSGFVLNKLSAQDARVSSRRIELYGMNLVTPFSDLKDTLVFKFRSFDDFDDFEDRVLMQTRFKNSKVALKDILYFAGGLKNNAFFEKNKEEIFRISGEVQGKVNSLKGKNLNIMLGQNTSFKGNFSSRNLSVKNEEFLNLSIEEMETDMQTLRLLVPGFDPPSNFDKLGHLRFDGKFIGFFIDFVADGNLLTDLGGAQMDMKLDLRQGRELAKYSGGLSLTDFNLKEWSGNDNLGTITFTSKVEEGQGLTIETVDANLGGKIDRFTFKGYNYENIELDGTLKQNLFDGDLTIKDEMIDLVFDGSLDFVDSIPKFDFNAKVNHLDLKGLNLIKDDLKVAGDIDLKLIDKNLSNIQGDAALRNIKIIKNGTEEYLIDSFLVDSKFTGGLRRSFNIDSEILKIGMEGYFDIQEVPEAILQYVERNYAELAKRFNVRSAGKEIKPSRFDFTFDILDSKNITTLFAPKLDTLRDISAIGYFDGITDSLYLELEVPELIFDKLEFVDVLLDVEGSGSRTNLEFEIYHTNLNGQKFEPLTLIGELEKDTFFFDIVSTNFTSIFDDLSLSGSVFPYGEKNFQASFLPSNLVILKQEWGIDADNYIRFGKNYVETKNFELVSNEKKIVLRSLEERGLRLGLENISLGLIDDFWDYENMDFSGSIDVELEAEDIFDLKGLNVTAISDTLEINGEDWGALDIRAEMPTMEEQTTAYITITKGDEQLTIEGKVRPIKAGPNPSENDFSANVTINRYPLQIAEYFVPNIISNTIGRFDADLKLYGPFKRPNIEGMVRIYDAGLTINYLKTRYEIKDSYTKVSNYMFDSSDNILTDSLGNEAVIQGGFVHDHFKGFGLDAAISSDRFLFMNTTKEDNEIYYGTALGSGRVTFKGPIKQIDIDINAKTGPGTKVMIPIVYGDKTKGVNFINYIEESDDIKISLGETEVSELRGVSVTMNVDMTPDAEVLLIFDEQSGDIIRGQGEGNINFAVARSGEITMHGTYEIVKGEYLFTLLNLINKPFTVKEGGTIVWEGDPFNAILNLEAEYKDLRTSLTNFVAEFIDPELSPNLASDAQKIRNIDLTMFLRGQLLQPKIDFAIDFPTLDGELRNLTDSKLRIIRQDQAELNRQVFGLLVIGEFIPSGGANTFQGGGLIPINTLTELLSNQLSIYLTDLLSEAFTDVEFISGFDLDVNYNIYQGTEISGTSVNTGSEFQVRPKLDLFNDRLSVNLGGNIDFGGGVQGTDGAFLAGDVVIEYALTKDRRFKVRAYQLTDQTFDGRRNKKGLGFSYRREFDSFKDFIKNMKNKKAEKEKNLIFNSSKN